MVPDALRRRGLRGALRGPGAPGAADGCAGGGHGDARAQRRRLEPRRPRGLHERLCTRLPHELRVGRPRAVRLAEALRPLPGDLLRAREDARFADVRGSARPATGARPRLLHRALQAGARRLDHGERAVHTGAGKAWGPLVHPARPYVERSEAVTRILRLCSLLGCALLPAACQPGGDPTIALEGATLIDGSGGAPMHDALIIVKNGHIETVARVSEARVPRGAQEISLVGKTIIPGLIDAHAHVERWAVQRYVVWGVTTVRDLGATSTDSAIALRNDLNLGAVLGPRMFTSGAMIDGAPPTYAAATAVRTRDEARRAVDQRAVVGADCVKIYTKLTPDLLAPLLDEAATLRLPVAAHLGKIDALTAARAGVASLEHMAGGGQAAAPSPGAYFRAHDQFLRGWTLEEGGWSTLDSAAVARVARTLAATHVAIVPTLVLHEMMSRLDNPTLLSRPGMEDVPAAATSVRDVQGLQRRAGWRAPELKAFRRSRARQDQFVREFKRAGGLIAAGSDAANQLLVPGLSLHEELSLLVGAGLTPLEALTAATRKGAELMHADSLGRIAPGKVADLVVLDADPAADIGATRRIAWVMIRGRMIPPDSLRRTWAH